jgi:hypothetical protein
MYRYFKLRDDAIFTNVGLNEYKPFKRSIGMKFNLLVDHSDYTWRPR